MGLIDRARRWLRGDEQRAYSGANWGDLWMRGQEYLLLPDQVVSPFLQVATVSIAVNAVADALSRIPVTLSRGSKVATDHPLIDVIAHSDSGLDGNQLLSATAIDLLIHGESFWLPDSLAANRSSAFGERVPRRILLLRPAQISHNVQGGEVVSWTYTSDRTGTITVPADEIVVFRRHNPYHEFRGLSPLQAARIEYQLEYQAGSWNQKFFANGARPSAYIYTPADQASVSPAQRQELQRAFEEEFASLANAHKWPVLGRGKEIRPIAISQKDMDFLEGRRFSREQILGIFRVPPSIAGVFEYANYANTKEQKRYFWANAVRPVATLVAAVMQSQLVDRYMPGWKISLDVESAIEKDIPEDYRERIDSALRLLSVGIPLSQLNEKMRLGFDLSLVPHADVSLISGGYYPADQMLSPPEPVTVDPPAKAAKGQRPRVAWRSFQRRLDGYEAQFHRQFVPVLNAAETATLASIPKTESIRKDAGDLIPADFGSSAEQAVGPVLVRVIREAGESLLLEAGRDLDFDWQDPSVQSHLNRRRVMIRASTDRMRRELRASLAAAVDKGESWDRMREIVHDAFDGFRANARTIARTEVNAAFSGGRIEAMTQGGVRRAQWITATDDFVRSSHAELDGAVADVGSNQWVKNGQLIATPLKFPHDPTAPASETINCRCVLVALEGDE